MTPDRAKALVLKQLPGYVIGWCVPYKSDFIVQAHPDDGPEDSEHGAYPDPFYAVNKLTGRVRQFVPAAEPDFGQSFIDTVVRELNKQRS